MEDGSIRIQPLHNEDVGLMGPFWSLTAHDNHYGEILQLATSFDDKYLFSVGADGNFFVHEFMDQEKIDQKVAENKAKIPSAKVRQLISPSKFYFVYKSVIVTIMETII